ncbi:ATP-binding protein [Actinacidiphila bryophytorum]|uniref:Adenylate cyclase n=1 Tax=Actinacidiphila bryophytorum TaxID=1436133 RepID=A0A9W4H2A8_9ACTN|nr:adenylate/guanylate cyclase domain-containing protein [Actinacidiphila bryophytorum]MBM9440165.1 AAA family ATPase [Actinacidiphila bryophytorum]MBN6541825.1 AAA family ATPase [Actinacidiphila bryophytorum]CAG7645006.1 Adenylate cyclase [Actinacidiphila bryophytorum]
MNCAACGRTAADSDRFCAGCGAPLAVDAPRRETRKRVSMLFMDLVGSTALAERLDPEPLRQVMDRYFASCGACIAEHGGAVEKFIGDAILAAFGATVAHEDDTLRAARAATEALAALEGLSAELSADYGVRLQARAGICTGDVVVVSTVGDDFRVIGDSVNTASRLQTAARPGEVLLCADTAAVVRGRIGVEPVAPLRLKGKAHAVPAWRITDRSPAEDNPLPDAPFIGRDDEREELEHGFRQVRQHRQVCLATVLGEPGIGKSRLVRQFLADMPQGAATVLTGHCSPYGRGITYQPLAEMLRSLPGGWPQLVRLVEADSGGGRGTAQSLVVRALGAVLGRDGADGNSTGQDGRPGHVGVEDIACAVRHLLEVLGRERPVIMIWEDLHWAEPTLLDLIDDIATWLQDVPVLLLCVARHELLDLRGSWGARNPRAATLELGPLTDEQTAELVGRLAPRSDPYPGDRPDDLLRRVTALCDGNPLFAEQLLDVFAETGPSTHIPPTTQAMLGARLDQLPGTERTLLEMAGVIGREFTPELLRAMAGTDGIGDAATDGYVARLTRRRIFERGSAGTFRFTQTLLRDTAYEFIPKSRREQWHGFLADQLADERPPDAMAVAVHVEASRELSWQLRPGDRSLPRLAGVAADTLIREGMSALARKDLPAAIQLLERGRELLPPGDRRHTPLALNICDAGIWLQDEQRCHSALAAAEAAQPDDPAAAATRAIQHGIVTLRLGLTPPAVVADQTAQIAAELDPGDDLSWCRLYQLQAHVELTAERAASAERLIGRGLDRARALNDGYQQDLLLCARCELAQWSPTPVATGLELCTQLCERFAAARVLLMPVLVTRARLQALGGDVTGARSTLAEALTYARDVHLDLADAVVLDASGYVESLAGEHEVAEARYRQSLDVLRSAEKAPDTRGTEIAIARELFAQGKLAAAASALGQAGSGSTEGTGSNDVAPSPRTRIASAALRARIASARGAHDDALAEATAACVLAARSDDLTLAGETFFDLAVVLHAAGATGRATEEAATALGKFEAKGAALPAARVRDWLTARKEGGTVD